MYLYRFTARSGKTCLALCSDGVTGRRYMLSFDIGTICDITGMSPLELANIPMEQPVTF